MKGIFTFCKSIDRAFLIMTAAFCIVLIVLMLVHQYSMPTFHSARYLTYGEFVGSQENERQYLYGAESEQPTGYTFVDFDKYIIGQKRTERTFTMPLAVASAGKNMHIFVDMFLGGFHPKHYEILVDDCLNELKINGEIVRGENAAFCGLEKRKINLSPYLHSGVNKIEAWVVDHGGWGVFGLSPHHLDPFVLMIRTLFFLLIAAYSIYVCKFFRLPRSVCTACALIFFCALLLRIYDVSFSYAQQAYDWDGHLDYIRYVLQNWNIPPAQGSGPIAWQYYQAPLYYFIGAGIVSIGQMMGRSTYLYIADLEMFSWLQMVFALGLTAWIGFMTFTENKHKYLRYLFILTIGVLPGLVMFSTRISNDVLFHLMSVIIIALLVWWWKKPTMRRWASIAVAISLAILTKLNALPFIPIACCAALLQPHIRLRKKIENIILLLSILIVVAGWYFALRYYIEGETFIVGNQGSLHIHLSFKDKLWYYFIFNPLTFIDIPFNNPWSDAHRRWYYFEYFYRSIFFGEFAFQESFRAFATFILLTGVPLIFTGIYGLLRELITGIHKNAPLWLTFFFFLAAGIAYRMISTYGSNQDFRFISPIAIPFVYYILVGMQHLPNGLRNIAKILLYCSIITWIFFIFYLVYYNS